VCLAIAALDWKLLPDFSLGPLYVILIVITAGFLARWQIVVVTVGCAVLREATEFHGWHRDMFVSFGMFLGGCLVAGFLVKAMAESQQLAMSQAREMERRRDLEEHLRHTQKMEAIGRLAGTVAHDFNNLLTVITSYAEFLLEKTEAGDPRRNYVEELQKAAERGRALTSQLLTFSRRRPVKMQEVQLNSVIAGLEGPVKRLLGNSIELELKLEPQLGPVRADQVQIEQVVMNLAVNARDAMPGGGLLVISTANTEMPKHEGEVKPQSFAELTVRDTGMGMDATTRARAFEPFFTTKDTGKGTGLGLSIVYAIVRQAGGQVRLESAPGSGTAFRLLFPRAETRA
jgi:two-component system cell cycle sensor histidine kinase/response regulator CckA